MIKQVMLGTWSSSCRGTVKVNTLPFVVRFGDRGEPEGKSSMVTLGWTEGCSWGFDSSDLAEEYARDVTPILNISSNKPRGVMMSNDAKIYNTIKLYII